MATSATVSECRMTHEVQEPFRNFQRFQSWQAHRNYFVENITPMDNNAQERLVVVGAFHYWGTLASLRVSNCTKAVHRLIVVLGSTRVRHSMILPYCETNNKMRRTERDCRTRILVEVRTPARKTVY